ncbi:hypothetical protein [Microtetraspora niveoalba]|uniref:hypothetical protein n=1 Tax=Microtetraspora niveoalba TaxID=46175 RepID=UPI0008335475|nr:hypothetical protein [Microtetraspora niveoalba]
MEPPPFHLRLIEDLHAARARFGLLLAGPYALSAHGFARRPGSPEGVQGVAADQRLRTCSGTGAGAGVDAAAGADTDLDSDRHADPGGDRRAGMGTDPGTGVGTGVGTDLGRGAGVGADTAIDFVTAGETPLAEVADGVIAELGRHGLAAEVAEIDGRMGRLVVTDEIGGQRCEVGLRREALRDRPAMLDPCPAVGLDDAVGLQVRALHDRGLPGDFAALVAVSELHPFREMERLGALHTDDWRLDDLLRRLETVDLLADEAFAACGLDDDGADAVRRFAYAWAEDIRLRRVEDGDIDEDTFDQDMLDIPDVD